MRKIAKNPPRLQFLSRTNPALPEMESAQEESGPCLAAVAFRLLEKLRLPLPRSGSGPGVRAIEPEAFSIFSGLGFHESLRPRSDTGSALNQARNHPVLHLLTAGQSRKRIVPRAHPGGKRVRPSRAARRKWLSAWQHIKATIEGSGATRKAIHKVLPDVSFGKRKVILRRGEGRCDDEDTRVGIPGPGRRARRPGADHGNIDAVHLGCRDAVAGAIPCGARKRRVQRDSHV